ncbi:MAG: hypothetical protein ACM3RX_10260 [Methanococcaceae archaeon]
MWLLVLSSSRASFLSEFRESLVVLIILSLLIFIKRGIKLDKYFYIGTVYFIILTSIYLLAFPGKEHSFLTYLSHYAKLFYAYLTIKILKRDVFDLYHNVIVKLALISLPLFFFQLILPDILFTINNTLTENLPFLKVRNNFSNTLLFSFTLEYHPLRNCGFMWEPGGFAGMLTIAILINLVRNRIQLNKQLFILIVALITTFSTTGYLVLGIIVVFILINKKVEYSFILIPIFLSLGIYISTLDFMAAKIVNILQDTGIELQVVSYDYYKGSIALNRFTSLLLDLHDMQKSPIIGIGFYIKGQTQNYVMSYNRSNGLSYWALQFGILGIIVLAVNFYLSFKLYLRKYNYKGAFIFPLLIMTTAFSNPYLYTYALLSFQLFYFCKNDQGLENSSELYLSEDPDILKYSDH